MLPENCHNFYVLVTARQFATRQCAANVSIIKAAIDIRMSPPPVQPAGGYCHNFMLESEYGSFLCGAILPEVYGLVAARQFAMRKCAANVVCHETMCSECVDHQKSLFMFIRLLRL